MFSDHFLCPYAAFDHLLGAPDMLCICRVCLYLLKLKLCEFIRCQRRTQPKRSSRYQVMPGMWQRGGRFDVSLLPCNCWCVISCSFEIACHMWQSTCRFHLVPSPKDSRPHPTMKIGLRMADVFSGGFVGDSYDLLYQWVLVSEGDDTWVACGCTKPCLSSMFVWRCLVVRPPTSKSI